MFKKASKRTIDTFDINTSRFKRLSNPYWSPEKILKECIEQQQCSQKTINPLNMVFLAFYSYFLKTSPYSFFLPKFQFFQKNFSHLLVVVIQFCGMLKHRLTSLITLLAITPLFGQKNSESKREKLIRTDGSLM